MLAAPGCDGSSPLTGKLFINEVLPSNSNGCGDELRERNDWVELYNAGDQEVSLEGYSMTDDSATPDKKRFGAGLVLGPNEVILIWADGTPDQGENHLTFKFKSKAEGVLLYDPEGRKVDEFRWTDAVSDVSFARLPDGSGEFARCAKPTCGTKNGASCAQ